MIVYVFINFFVYTIIIVTITSLEFDQITTFMILSSTLLWLSLSFLWVGHYVLSVSILPNFAEKAIFYLLKKKKGFVMVFFFLIIFIILYIE